ncbi:hypothetical protein UA08_05820 [Talaromyces atroroseus]|uniref:XRCC4 coiled-coil domain-containing protein n=1 Tax=Talaromyces atroroseus TaxID=1441469 RepID=A0A225AE46_TALAT|nr:hypothetical protein UA08_05820 [Talaromyces atroroseus]OKL58780.1 hypothetical protein UA08_05820 [Talaromyces atroroseus]
MPADKKKSEWVIRIPKSDNASDFVLVHVSSASGKAALDLKFIATEGENPYVGSLRRSRLKDVRSKNFQGTEQEFEEVLSSVLRVDHAADQPQQQHAEIETTASIREAREGKEEEGNNELVISIRRRIDSITQRVASITLYQNDDQTIELFEWMGLTLSLTDRLSQQLATLTSQLSTAEQSMRDLKSSLEDLTAAKKEHENRLISNFALVLNEKKRKIRNQQRLLEAAKVDPEKVRELQEAIRHDQVQKSRQNKRKAAQKDQVDEDSDEEDDFEKMDIDKPKARKPAGEEKEEEFEENDEDEERPETPQPLEEEGETESEAESQVEEDTKPDKRPNLANNAAEPPPPKRDLPFLRRTKNDNDKKIHGDVEAAEDVGGVTGGETDDDEL